ncbi:hypothetical protein D3C72_1390160 [compost metagenome]
MCSSHLSAVSVLRGSMHTSRAPARLAAWAWRQKCRLLAMELLPQMRMSLASAKNSMRMPTLAPSV